MGDGVGGAPPVAGVRASPNFQPTPNSVPQGAMTGAPIRTQLFSRPINAQPTQIVIGTKENRVAILLAPVVGFTIFIGDSSVNERGGFALPPGQTYEVILPGLQELYAITNAPVTLQLQIQVAPVLMAERERRMY
jgi:hypothetical protein